MVLTLHAWEILLRLIHSSAEDQYLNLTFYKNLRISAQMLNPPPSQLLLIHFVFDYTQASNPKTTVDPEGEKEAGVCVAKSVNLCGYTQIRGALKEEEEWGD